MNFKYTTIAILIISAFLGVLQTASAEGSYQTAQNEIPKTKELFSDYMKSVQDKLSAQWQPPDFMEEGHVKVHFNLNKQGRVMNAYVFESSGNDIYDESAIEAIKDCSPFGNFPKDSLREHISIKYSFDTILIEDERTNGYYKLAKLNTKNNPRLALEYLNMAISKVGGEEASSFLYERRAEIKERLGDTKGAKEDFEIHDLYTNRTNIKRVHLLKHLAETKPTAYNYHYLAFAYEQVNDYNNAIAAIDKAICLTDDNHNLKNYKRTLLKKLEAQN